MIKSAVGVDEKKSFYSTASGSATSTSTVACLTSIPQGVTAGSRTGDKCLATDLEFKVGFTGGDATNYVRATFIKWVMNDSNDACTSSDVYQNNAVPWLSLLQAQHPNRFELLYDEVCCIGTSGTDACIISGKLKLKHEISFNATATTGIGHVYLLMTSDSSAATHPVYSLEARVEYIDP
jgi:hypothetical protein